MLHGFWTYFLLADMKWVTLDILIVHACSVMHHPPPSPGVFMLAAIMRGFFIIHIMIDVPLVVVFMLQSHMIVLCQEHTAAKHCGPQPKMLSVAVCWLLAEKHSLKSLYPRLGR